MPPKRHAAISEATPSKSLFNFFGRSPDAHHPGSTGSSSTRKNGNNQGLKRLKGKNTTRYVGTLNAPLVISDDEAPENQVCQADVIDISDDDLAEDKSSGPHHVKNASTSLPVRRGRERSSVGESTNAFRLRPAQSVVDTSANIIANHETSHQPPAAQRPACSPSPEVALPLRQTGPIYDILMDLGSQKSELEQALAEEEGQWNEGDDEGMGMEDLDIADEEDAVQEAAPEDDNADDIPGAVEGGEKRKRKGKQKTTATKDCSPQIIAIEDSDSDSGGDDDSLGEREDEDDFDVDDDECPVCGRTFVGLQGDVSCLSVCSFIIPL